MHSQDVLKFIKENKGITIREIAEHFPNTSPEIITKAVYLYLKERRG